MTVFRDDKVALAEQNSQLRSEVEQLRAENTAMRATLQGYNLHTTPVYAHRSIYNLAPGELTEGDRVAFGRHSLKAFSPGAAVALHVLTMGLWSMFHFARIHEALPKLKSDDPGLGRAIGMFFVPYVNIWWMFFSPLRLIDRINFQFMLRNRERPLTKGLAVLGAVLSFFLYFTLIFLPLGWVFAVWKTQKAVNELIDLGDVVPAHAYQAQAYQQGSAIGTGVRVDGEWGFESPPAAAESHEFAPPAQHVETSNKG